LSKISQNATLGPAASHTCSKILAPPLVVEFRGTCGRSC